MRTPGYACVSCACGPALPTPPWPAYPGNGCYQRVSSGSRVNGPSCGHTFHRVLCFVAWLLKRAWEVLSGESMVMWGGAQRGTTAACFPYYYSDIFTKNTIEAEQFFRLRHTLCGYKSWSVLEEITTKAAAIAIVVEGRYLTVTDMRACSAYASACHAQLRLIGDPHGGYYDESRVWHPHVKAPAQATYGLGVGATTVVGPGGSRSRWASGSAPGAVSPGQTRSTDPTKARSSSLVQ